jgi:hypothetical protein
VIPFALALALDELPREFPLNEFFDEQDRDPEIGELLATGGPSCVIDVNPYGIIVREAPLYGCKQLLADLGSATAPTESSPFVAPP